MLKHTVTFRMDAEKTKALDVIASVADRDRSYVLNEAVDDYLEVHRWQNDHIRRGLRQAEKGELASDAEVADAFRKWRR